MSTRRGRKYYLDAALRHVEKTGRRVERIDFAMDGSFSFVLANGESVSVSGDGASINGSAISEWDGAQPM